MTVHQLIRELQDYDPSFEVQIEPCGTNKADTMIASGVRFATMYNSDWPERLRNVAMIKAKLA